MFYCAIIYIILITELNGDVSPNKQSAPNLLFRRQHLVTSEEELGTEINPLALEMDI